MEAQDTLEVTSEPETDIASEEALTDPDTQDQELLEDSENSEDPDGDSTELSENVREVQVKGKDGKRRKIKVDLTDHDKIVKYVQKAANATRLQSERDALQARLDKAGEAEQALNTLQETLDVNGVEGLIDQLLSDQGGFKGWWESKIDRYELRQGASEDELKYLEEQEKREALQRRMEYLERQQAEREERVAHEREQADRDKKASNINPAYFKHNFDGKFGDPEFEQEQNEVMFRNIARKIDSLEEQGVNVTAARIDKLFRDYSSKFLKNVNRKVRSNTKKAMDNKKAQATSHAQQQVRRGYEPTKNKEMDEAIKNKDWTSLALSMMGKRK